MECRDKKLLYEALGMVCFYRNKRLLVVKIDCFFILENLCAVLNVAGGLYSLFANWQPP